MMYARTGNGNKVWHLVIGEDFHAVFSDLYDFDFTSLCNHGFDAEDVVNVWPGGKARLCKSCQRELARLNEAAEVTSDDARQ